ncbi:MAG: hypothetical protein OXT69_01625 [Candidatus Poribacteria bacterium]|nr:hypothetical protein [Candidatus Poribacteria bacterium]
MKRICWISALALFGSLTFAAFAQDTPAEAADSGFLRFFREDAVNPLWATIIVSIVITVIKTIHSAVRRDKILKRHLGKYLQFRHKGGAPKSGIFKMILKDVEIASEKTDVQGKDSGRLFSHKEFHDKFEALVRYHDEMTQADTDERKGYIQRSIHPTIFNRFRKRLLSFFRLLGDQVKVIWDQAIGTHLNKLRGLTAGYIGAPQIQKMAETQVEEITGISKEGGYNLEDTEGGTSYRMLIDRLLGTKVLAHVMGKDRECILADYTLGGYYHLLDVKLDESFELNIEWGKQAGKWVGGGGYDRIVRATRKGNEITIESRAQFPLQLTRLEMHGGRKIADKPVGNKSYDKGHKHNHEKINIRIEPYGKIKWKKMHHERRKVAQSTFKEIIGPGYDLGLNDYGHVKLRFNTSRMADCVIKYQNNAIKYRAEKVDAQDVQLDSLAEALWRTSSRLEITDEKGNRIRGMHLNSGYVTNLSKDLVNIPEVRGHYSKRWDNERSFDRFERKSRPLRWSFSGRLGALTGRAKKAAAQVALMQLISREKQLASPDSWALQFPIARRRRDLKTPAPPHKLPMRIGVLTQARHDEEISALNAIKSAADHRMLFRRESNPSLPCLDKMDILYLGMGANLQNLRGFNRQSEERIRRFAAQGGIIIAFPPNTKPRRGGRLGWIPDPLVETEDRIASNVKLTRGPRIHEPGGGLIKFEVISAIAAARVSRIFLEPNELELEEIPAAVGWSVWSDRFTEIASVDTEGPYEGEKAAVALTLPYGRGLYMAFGFGPRRPADFEWSVPLVENILTYAALWKDRLEKQKRRAA